MVVINTQRTTAIVIHNDGFKVTLVPMKGGKLSARSMPFESFREEWFETAYPLPKALASFQHHAEKRGASCEVVKGLTRLLNRDRWVVASLF